MAIDNSRPLDGDDLQRTAEEARRIAAEAAREAELERPTAAGAGGHPHPDIRAADHLRAGDDVRTFERQADAAQAQARAAEILEETGARLEQTREQLEEVREDVHDRRGDVRAIAHDTAELDRQVDDARDQVRDTPTPDVG